MSEYSRPANNILKHGEVEIASFLGAENAHLDEDTVRSFGDEWDKFDQFTEQEIRNAGDQYFDIVPEGLLDDNTRALDLGCGSGRWTRYLASQVGSVEAIDPNYAIAKVAELNSDLRNVRFTQAGVGDIPFHDQSFDLIVCLGVLHHVPDTAAAIDRASIKLRSGGHFLLYLYYALDGRGPLYKALFKLSSVFRRSISKMPGGMKRFVCDLIAVFIYMPFVIIARSLKAIGMNIYKKIPLSYYSDKSFKIIRNDALDRFGTPLEQRFSKTEITEMMKEAGMVDLVFSENEPFWHVLGTKR